MVVGRAWEVGTVFVIAGLRECYVAAGSSGGKGWPRVGSLASRVAAGRSERAICRVADEDRLGFLEPAVYRDSFRNW